MNTPWNNSTMQDTLNQLAGEFEKERIRGLSNSSTVKVAKAATQVILHTASTIGAIAGTVFAPAPVIAEGLLFVLRATEKVSDQLDQIEKFFKLTASFFKRLAILEGRLPDGPQFAEQILNVFDRLLGFIVDAQVYVARGKFKNFIKELAKPSTPLSDTHAMFQDQLNRLDSAAMFCTLGISVDVDRNVKDIRDSVDVIAKDTHHIVGKIDGLSTNIVDLHMQLGNFRQDFRSFSYEVRYKPATEKVRNQIGDTVTVDRVTYQAHVLGTLRASFDIGDTESLHRRRLAKMLSSRLLGTCEWIYHQEAYQTLLDGSSQTLLIKGNRHTGRSMLLSFIFEHIKNYKRQLPINRTKTPIEPACISVAYFCFGQECGGRNSVDDMIRCCVIQIVEQEDHAYRKWAMDHCLREKSQNTNPTWTDYFVKGFSSLESDSPQPWLFLILDDVDIVESRESLNDFRQSIKDRKLRISLILTAASNLDRMIPKGSTIALGDGNTNAGNDLRTFTKHLAMSLPRLSDFPQKTHETLVNEVCKKATTYLYVDYALRRFDVDGGSNLSLLETFQTDCKDIYKDLFHTCTKDRNAQEGAQLQCLFTWLAFCKNHYISLGAAKLLLELVFQWPIFQEPKEDGKSSHETPANPENQHHSNRQLGLAAGDRLKVELAGNLSLLLSRSAPVSRPTKKHQEDAGHEGDDDLIQFRHSMLQAFWSTGKSSLPSSSAEVLMFKMLSHILSWKSDVGKHMAKSRDELKCQAATLWFEILRTASSPYVARVKAPDNAPVKQSRKKSERTREGSSRKNKPGSSSDKNQQTATTGDTRKRNKPATTTPGRKKTQASLFIAKTMVEGIAHVFSNENNALKLLEAEVDWEACQSLLGTNDEEVDNTLEMISYWLYSVQYSQMAHLPEGTAARTWLKIREGGVEDKLPCRVLEELAKSHRANWLAAQFPSAAYISFRFAYQAQRDWERHDASVEVRGNALDETTPKNRAETILKVARDLTNVSMNQDNRLLPSIATAMALRYDGLHQFALEEVLKGAEMIEAPDNKKVFKVFKDAFDKAIEAQNGEPGPSISGYEDDLQKHMFSAAEAKHGFEVYNRIGRICYGQGEDKTDMAIEDGALSLPPTTSRMEGYLKAARIAFVTALQMKPGDMTSMLPEERRNILRTYWLKAKVEAVLGDHERALRSIMEAVNCAKATNQETTTGFFDELVYELGGNQNGSKKDGSKNVLELLENVGHMQFIKGCMAETHRRIHKAAKREGESAARRVNETYKKAVDHLVEENDAAAQTLSIWWADFVRFVLAELKVDEVKEVGEAKDAEHILRRALNVKAVGNIDTIFRISWRLSDILLNQFLDATTKKQELVDKKDTLVKKQAALDKMMEVMSQLEGIRPEFEGNQSQMSIPLSIMRRKLGPALAFFEGADMAFRGCIKALTDERQDNDAPSFQILAKVLCLVPDLEEHAEIAASCQFYVINDGLFTNKYQSPVSCSYCERVVAGDVQTEAVYLCCYCTNTFACQSCHKKNQTARNRAIEAADTSEAEADTIVLQVPCRREHMYIAARGDSWSGVRNGKMIRKGEPEKELSFTDWLRELEQTWEAAWQEFWSERPPLV
ncbi:hypothetical protein BGZ61DRAFT_539214 [Ilyonectria robusta]|uniref:uncharacterized protein n=1 Tax=Ilyonectria robusta TaxID=1079257 RepID=UPI001E8DEF5F|nr:uncharacterized protein BGZ61DRAFT_539214 [Ilyonectria robusta]KAH8663182.1 hypothetical protein BGZ61DRAFT_539214 [Ilyonectria robusta]